LTTNVHRILRHHDGRFHEIALDGDELAFGIGVEGAGAGVENLAFRPLNLEPALAVDGEVELVGGVGQCALHMQVADGRRLHTEPDLGAFRDGRLAAAHRHTLELLRLVEQIGELGAGALEAGGVDIGDVVGDDFDVHLLGVHARGGDGEGAHGPILLRSASG